MSAQDRSSTIYVPAYDLHNHTIYCGHAVEDATVENVVEGAEQLGLDCFGISEHVIFAEDAERIQQIREDLARMDRNGSDMPVLVGAEIDADPLHLDGRWVVDPGPLDYAILSPHRIPGWGIGHWEFRERAVSETEKRRIGEVWLDWYEACIERAEAQILGHPLREPMTLRLFSLQHDRTFDRALQMLRRAAALGTAFELNNGWAIGLQELGEFELYVTLVRELKAAGMRFTRGSDSHAVADIGTDDGIRQMAQAAGLEAEDWLAPAELCRKPLESAPIGR